MKECLVIGGKGFIGSHIVAELISSGFQVVVPERGDRSFFQKSYDAIIYAAGFGVCTEPNDVLEANVLYFNEILMEANYKHFIYLSSTRVYMSTPETHENVDILMQEQDPRKLFNLSKLISEEIARLSGKNITIIRPSNVYGTAINSNLFLPMIVKNALLNNRIDMYVAPEYEKDYVSVKDVAEFVTECVFKQITGFKIYNVASGVNISAKKIADIIQKETQCDVKWHEGFNGEKFTPIDIKESQKDFDFKPKNLLNELPGIITSFKENLINEGGL